MGNIFKIILWLAVLFLVGYLIFGSNKNKAEAPTPEMTGGAAGDRAEGGLNMQTEGDLSTDFGITEEVN